MSLIIVSNRAPVKIHRGEQGLEYQAATGGLATGLQSYVEHEKTHGTGPDILWIGWPGGVLQEAEREEVTQTLRSRFGVEPVYLSEEAMDRFYLGFCNKTIWPLFHYFPTYVEYDASNWEDYVQVNQAFASVVRQHVKPGDTVWIQDYHLMLLPSMLRRSLPEARIGFFLHIPFPSHEVFRLLPSPWREQIIRGLLGADVIGFHTPEYTAHFLDSAKHSVRLEQTAKGMLYHNRPIGIHAFPMGIEYTRFHDAPQLPEVEQECAMLHEHLGENKVVLSVDRQDYTKGILNRLDGYEYFLDQHEEWRGKVTMLMVVVPSRVGVEDYQTVKGHIDEAVGRINGKFSRLGWAPIVYQYRELGFEELIALYTSSEIALVTPLRDGMNLIAKEYIATRMEQTGVLILSEMAGAASELKEAILVNPNYREELGEAIQAALAMPLEEQVRRMSAMQTIIRENDVVHWATEFLDSIAVIKAEQAAFVTPVLKGTALSRLVTAFKRARSRLLLLDYDGTLTPIVNDPATAVPSEKLLGTLLRLAHVRRTEVAIVSGRDRATLERWFGTLPISLIAEHGAFIRRWPNRWVRGLRRLTPPKWKKAAPVTDAWKPALRTELERFAELLPGAWVEEKEYSIAFHYRNVQSRDAPAHIRKLVERLGVVVAAEGLQIVEGRKIVEVRVAALDKGVATRAWLGKGFRMPGFVMAIGDDTTDEDLFAAMPATAFTIKVGSHPSKARSRVDAPEDVLDILRDLAAVGPHPT